MAWVRLDDRFDDDPRVATVGLAGAGLLAQSLAYSNRNLTDGWIPAGVLQRFMRDDLELLDKVLRVGMLSPCDRAGIEGFQIHADYTQYQPTREEIFEKMRKKTEAGRHGGFASGKARRKQRRSNREANAQAERTPDPDPDPHEEKSTGAVAPELPPYKNERSDPTHALLRKLAHEVVSAEPDSTYADHVEVMKVLCAKRGMTYGGLHAVKDALDAVLRMRSRSNASSPTTGPRSMPGGNE